MMRIATGDRDEPRRRGVAGYGAEVGVVILVLDTALLFGGAIGACALLGGIGAAVGAVVSMASGREEG